MKYLALAALLAVMQAGSPAPRKAANPHTSGTQNVKGNASDDQSPSDARSLPKQQTESAQTQDERQTPADANARQTIAIRESAPVLKTGKDAWDKAYVIFTGALVVIGFVGVGCAVVTLWAIREQVTVMTEQRQVMLGQLRAMREQISEMSAQTAILDKSVAVAKDSADALVNAERPWVSATVRRTVKNIPVVRNGVTIHNAVNPVTLFDFVLKNHGRTPAEIFAVRAKTEPTTKGIDGGFASDGEPDYGLHDLQHIKLLAPNEEWEPDLDTINLYLGGYSDREREAIQKIELHILFWGVVLYRDQFRVGVAHETRFCYTYLQGRDDYRPSGPRQYTRYT